MHEKINGRSVTGSKGSCLLCSMLGNSLDNLGKSTGECKNKQSDKFPNFLKIFENLRKSSEVFGRLRKSSEKIGNLSQSAQNNFAAVFFF